MLLQKYYTWNLYFWEKTATEVCVPLRTVEQIFEKKKKKYCSYVRAGLQIELHQFN